MNEVTKRARLKQIMGNIEKQYGHLLGVRQALAELETTTSLPEHLDPGLRKYPDQPIHVWMGDGKIVAGYIMDTERVRDGSIAYCGGLVLVDPDVPLSALIKMTCDHEHKYLFKFLG
jgi:hypothetical protein